VRRDGAEGTIMTVATQTSPRATSPEIGVVVLLVDDQVMIGEAVRRMLASEEDITFHYCQDPTQAVALAAEVRPTVILQDLIMPEIDGLDLVVQYREQEGTRLTPLIVLSTKEEADTKATAFARGANDYLVKLPDPVELIARIRYHSRGYIALLERNHAFAELAASQQALTDEIAKAARYVSSLLPARFETGPVTTDARFIPSVALGGDSFDYHWIDDDHLVTYLVDVSGHGVGPALMSVSAMNVLRSHSLPDVDFTDPSQVLVGMNHAFQMAQHGDMYLTMWYGVYTVSTRELRYTGGGHPPGLLVRGGGGAEPEMLESNGPMVGVMLDEQFESNACTVAPEDRLYVYSDGVYEIRKTNDTLWTFKEFRELMGRPIDDGVSRIDRLLTHTRELQGSELFEDDFSMLELKFA
jgi:sigma-B regulation protein RsbU (phosphoserine phosphatase)